MNPVPIYSDRSWICVACEWRYISKNWTLKVAWEGRGRTIKSHPFVFQQVTIWPPLFDKLLNIPVLCAETVFSPSFPRIFLIVGCISVSLTHFTWSFYCLSLLLLLMYVLFALRFCSCSCCVPYQLACG